MSIVMMAMFFSSPLEMVDEDDDYLYRIQYSSGFGSNECNAHAAQQIQ